MKRLLASVFVFVVSTGTAWSVPGNAQDPDDVNSIVDIRGLYHHDDPTSGRVTYYVEWWNNVGDANWVCTTFWDFDQNGSIDGSVQYALEFGPTALVYNANGEEVGSGSISRAAVAPPHSSATSRSTNTVRVSVERSAMSAAGMAAGDSGYRYYTTCRQQSPEVDDEAPGGAPTVNHTFGPGTDATARPAPQPTPTPVPSGQPARPTASIGGPTGTPDPASTTAPAASAAAGESIEPSPTASSSGRRAAGDEPGTPAGRNSTLPWVAGLGALILAGSAAGLVFARRGR